MGNGLTEKQRLVLLTMRRHRADQDALPPSEISRLSGQKARYWAADKLMSLECRGMVKRAGWADRERCWWITTAGLAALCEHNADPVASDASTSDP